MAESTPPVLELIAANVLTSLSGYQGYVNAMTFTRRTRKEVSRHLAGTIYQLTAQHDDDAAPVMTEERREHFAIVLNVDPLETDQTPLDGYLNFAVADIEKALMADRTRGGLAINTVILPTLKFPPVNDESAGIVFNFEVLYRTLIDDPYTVAVG